MGNKLKFQLFSENPYTPIVSSMVALVHAAAAAAKAAARLAHEQATGHAAEDDLGVSEERGVRAEARSRV